MIKENFSALQHLLLLGVFVLLSNSISAQSKFKIDTGRINHAKFKILIPEHWQRKLIMYAHGYEFMGSASGIDQDNFDLRMHSFLERGYAVAASAYRIQGFALPQGVDDTEALRKYFIKKYGPCDTTFIIGHSMGGGVTIATMENFGVHYKGALPMCPLSSRPYLQCRKEFDMYAVFNALFPGIIPTVSDVMDSKIVYHSIDPRAIGPKIQSIREGFMKDSVLAYQFAKHFDLKLSDLAMSLTFNENILRDIAQKCGGNPFDNTNTLYSGYPDDWNINKKVERLQASVDENIVFGKYDRTGNINKPILLLHTIYDQLIPPQYGVTNFENMVHQQNKDKYLTVKYTNGQGHCAFTDAQVAQAFDALRSWVISGKKAKAGIIE